MNACRRWSQILLLLPWLAACGAAPVQPTVTAPTVDQRPPRPQVTPFARPDLPEPVQLAVTVTGTELRLHVVERHDTPVVELRWVLPGGRLHEQGAKRWPEGTLQLATELLTEGTRTHPGSSWAAAMARHGAQLSVRPLGDAVLVELQVLGHQLPPTLALVREALLEPVFDAKALASLKQRHAADLRNEQGDVDAVAARLSRRLAYGDASAYGAMGLSSDGLARVKRKHVLDAWATAGALGNSDLVVVGDVSAEALRAQLQTLWATSLRTPVLPLPAPVTAAEAACHVIDVPETVQAALLWTSPGPSRMAAEWPLLTLANQVVGGSASSRLFEQLREKQGLTYGISSGFEGLRHAGRWQVASDVATEKVSAALTAVEAELGKLRSQPPSEDEIAAARWYLQGQFVLALSSPGNIADLLAARFAYGLPADHTARWFDAIARANATDVQAVLQTWLPKAPQSVVVAGALQALRPGLDTRCPRLILHDVDGRTVRVLVGRDAEMGDEGRAQAFRLWGGSEAGQAALVRYLTDPTHAGSFRAQALAQSAAEALRVLPLARQAPDWPVWRTEVAARLLPALDGDTPAALGAGAVLLAMASTPADLAEPEAATARAAVARWALQGVQSSQPAAELRASAEKRLQSGDLGRLGSSALAPYVDALAAWIAADAHRLDAAHALLEQHTASANRALVRGYRAWLQAGGVPSADDIAALVAVEGPEGLLLLFDSHGQFDRSTAADASTNAARVMQALQAALPRHLEHSGQTFEPFVGPLESVLARRRPADRWWAASWLVRGQGLTGLRKVLDGLPADDSWQAPDGANRQALVRFAREVVAPLDRSESQPLLLASVHARSPMARVVAVKSLHALGDEASIAALRTLADDTDVSSLFDVGRPLTMREVAMSACDAVALSAEFDAAAVAGQMTFSEAKLYAELAFGFVDLQGPRLRAEVLRVGHERLRSAKPAGQPAR